MQSEAISASESMKFANKEHTIKIQNLVFYLQLLQSLLKYSHGSLPVVGLAQ